MKLVIITAISDFSNTIKKILKNSGVKTFTYKEVRGYKDVTEEHIETNWFGSEMNETDSVLFYVFTEVDKIDNLFTKVEEFNQQQEAISKIHIVSLNIEKSNN